MERRAKTVAVAPLVSDTADPEHSWLGASLGKLLSEHLSGAGLPTLHYNAVAEATLKLDRSLPLEKRDVEAITKHLKLSALVDGGFRLEGGQLHLSLAVHADDADTTPTPLTDSSPTTAFAQQIERVAVELVRRLGSPLNEAQRESLKAVPRPRSFSAFRQLARARAAWTEEDFPLALSFVSSALQLEPTLEEAGEIKIGVGRAAGRANVVREGFEQWADLAGRNDRPLARAERLLLYGHWLVSQAEWDDAEDAYREALSVYESEGVRLGEAQALDNLAGLAMRRGRPDEAVKSYQKSMAVYEMLDAQEDVATATFNLALGYKVQGDNQSALDALERALKMARERDDGGLEAAALDQRGTLHAADGDTDSAQEDYERAVTLYEKVEDPAGLATVKDHLAALHAQSGDYAAAEALRLEAVAIFESLGDTHELAVAWTNLAALYVEMGSYEQAWDYASRAHEVFTRLGSAIQQVTGQLLADLS